MKWTLSLPIVVMAGCTAPVAQVVQAETEPKTVRLSLPTSVTEVQAPPPRKQPDRLGVPVYPSASYVDRSERLRIKAGETLLSRTYHAKDGLPKVAAFYDSEAPQIGRVLSKTGAEDTILTWVVTRADKRTSTVVATRMKDGSTSLTLQTSTPNRRGGG